MDNERKNRYLQKIKLAYKRLENIEEDLSNFDREIIKLGIYKAFQELVEVLTDIAAMIIIDKKINMGDDYSNIQNIKGVVGLNDKEVEIFNEANGLRNRIIHKYNKTEDKQAKESIERLILEIDKILNKLSEFTEKNENNKAKNKNK